MASFVSVALVAVALGSTTPSYADPDTERARALFDEAGELESRAQWGPAQDRLRAALRLRETPQLYYALGWALEADDKLLEARTEYETAIRLGRERAGGEEAARLASARLEELERNTPVVRVRIADDPRGVRVVIDGRELKREGDFAAKTPVNPGSHVVRVERAAAIVFEKVVYVPRGTTRTIDLGDGSGPASERTTQASSGNTVLPWVLVSTGAVLALSGSTLLVTTDATNSDRDTKRGFGVALVGTGVIAAAVGTVLLLRGEDKARATAIATSLFSF